MLTSDSEYGVDLDLQQDALGLDVCCLLLFHLYVCDDKLGLLCVDFNLSMCISICSCSSCM